MPTIAVIACQHPAPETAPCTEAIRSYLTTGQVVSTTLDIVCLTPAELIAPMTAGNGGRTGTDACLILLGPALDDTSLMRLLDAIEESGLPGVVVAQKGGRDVRATIAGCESLIVAPPGSAPDAVGALLYAQLRQGLLIRSMQRRLDTVHSFQKEAAHTIETLHDELLLAAKVQREFLPKYLPTLNSLGIAVAFRPAGFVSGDIYEVVRLDENHIGFFLADAMGHGVPAALMTLFICGSLPQKEIEGMSYRIIPPAESLRRLNRHLCATRVEAARYCTAVCGVYEVPTGIVTVAGAGHPHPLRIRGERVEAVETTGPLLGVFDDAEFDQATFELSPGEVLIFHSDGLEEAYGGRKEDQSRSDGTPVLHLAALVRSFRTENEGNGERDVADRLRTLEAELDALAGSMHQSDDVTVLALGRKREKH